MKPLFDAMNTELADRFGDVLVNGTVRRLTKASSGHVYFELVAGDAMIRCMMFRGLFIRERIEIADGDRVEARGKIEMYAPKGAVQLVVAELKHQPERQP